MMGGVLRQNACGRNDCVWGGLLAIHHSMASSGAALTEEIGRGLLRVRRRAMADAARRLEERGEQILRWQVLNCLDREGASSQSALSAATGQHPTGLSRVLEELETAACVRRARSVADKRRNVVELTRKGRARLEAGRPAVLAAYEQVLAPLAHHERKTLRDLLVKLLTIASVFPNGTPR